MRKLACEGLLLLLLLLLLLGTRGDMKGTTESGQSGKKATKKRQKIGWRAAVLHK